MSHSIISKEDIYLLADKCYQLLIKYSFFIDSPLVSFFQDDHWKHVEQLGWSQHLLSLSHQDISLLPDPKQFPISPDTPESLVKFVACCLDTCSSLPAADSETDSGFVKLGMSPKKEHEVSRMSSVVKKLAEEQGVSQIIDFGSGKGYLPEHLALTSPGVRVVGIDREHTNTRGGLQRNILMKKLWGPLFKKQSNGEFDWSKGCMKQSNGELCMSKGCMSKGCMSKGCMNHYVPVTLELTSDHVAQDFVGNISIQSRGHIAADGDTMLIGLHACGDLTSLLLQTFLKCSRLKSIVSVGCCYHLITQRERTVYYMTADSSSGSSCAHREKSARTAVTTCVYPMSSYLQQSPLYFTRNALNLASQAPERMSASRSSPAKNIFFRAVLQVLLHDLFEKLPPCNVGQAATRAPDFLTYCKAAFRKLQLEITMTDSDIISYYNKFNGGVRERQIYIFYQLRTLLTRVIECLILVDRMLYLHDNEIQCSVFRLFDPIISPRCYVLVAKKSC